MSLYGIVNGTSNYILTRMTEEGRDFAEALREAQAAGYAEADPTLDIEGIDSAHKLQILASLAFRTGVELKEIHTEGITRLAAPRRSPTRGSWATGSSCSRSPRRRTGPSRRACIPPDPGSRSRCRPSPACSTRSSSRGTRWATRCSTAGAPVRCPPPPRCGRTRSRSPARLAHGTGRSAGGPAARPGPEAGGLRLRPMEDIRSAYYLRVMVLDRPGVLVAGGRRPRPSRHLDSPVLQKERHDVAAVPIVMMTHEARERNMTGALEEIDRLDVVAAPHRHAAGGGAGRHALKRSLVEGRTALEGAPTVGVAWPAR